MEWEMGTHVTIVSDSHLVTFSAVLLNYYSQSLGILQLYALCVFHFAMIYIIHSTEYATWKKKKKRHEQTDKGVDKTD